MQVNAQCVLYQGLREINGVIINVSENGMCILLEKESVEDLDIENNFKFIFLDELKKLNKTPKLFIVTGEAIAIRIDKLENGQALIGCNIRPNESITNYIENRKVFEFIKDKKLLWH